MIHLFEIVFQMKLDQWKKKFEKKVIGMKLRMLQSYYETHFVKDMMYMFIEVTQKQVNELIEERRLLENHVFKKEDCRVCLFLINLDLLGTV